MVAKRRTRAVRSTTVRGAAFILASMVIGVASASPAVGEDLEEELSANDAALAVQEVAGQSDTGAIEDAETFVVESDGSRVVVGENTETSIEAGSSPTITLDSDTLEPLYVSGGLEGEAEVAADGTTVYETGQGYSVVPLPYEDGAVQLINVIAQPTAPDRYEYDFSSTTEVNITLQDEVAVISDANGTFLGGVTTPWAYDANGVAVPTHFEAAGNTLIQVVEHSSGAYTYPITADPYAGQRLWSWITVDTNNGDKRVNLEPTNFGRGMPPWVMTGAGWSEANAWSTPVSSALTSKATMRQQFDCHAFGNAFAGTWNLERFRYNRSVSWDYGVGTHHCNWKTAGGI